MESLWITIQHRPYVFAFLFTFLILATLHFGLWRTLIWLLLGYTVAFISEYSSIRNGFPYGLYHYNYEFLHGELILGGVPIWDSASYAFIAYASYATACFLIEPMFGRFKMDPHVSPSRPFAVTFLGSVLMMLADVIIDPVSNLGERWFLGDIYFYPHGGIYFGVPISNFLGWFLVALITLMGFQIMEKWIFTPLRLPSLGAKRFSYQGLLGVGFYFGILFFMLAITFAIQSHRLLAASSTITFILLAFVSLRTVRDARRT